MTYFVPAAWRWLAAGDVYSTPLFQPLPGPAKVKTESTDRTSHPPPASIILVQSDIPAFTSGREQEVSSLPGCVPGLSRHMHAENHLADGERSAALGGPTCRPSTC